MHIPDGYLSPSTCVGLYAAATPFWYVALHQVKSTLHTRAAPLLAVFAAFSFVVMMFNLPLPGGTTGHAVGMGMAAIVLGPWVSILAISMALFIQALFFGDGGLTTLGANCFNMAIAGSLVAYGVYRTVSAGAGIMSARRTVAAGLAGYAGINVAALLAAIEFGVQPLWFHDTTGAPLYAPYPLSISIPAMMIGHLTFAGMAEFILTAGVVRYFQRADPAMLRLSAPEAEIPSNSASRFSSRKLWLAVATAVCLTPLGVLAIGSAWGEWKASDFSDAKARQEIALASGNQGLPERAPHGLQRLSALWKAPWTNYSQSFTGNKSIGYLVSASMGVALVIVAAVAVGWLSLRRPRALGGHRSFVERTILRFSAVVHDSLFAEQVARSKGLLQSIDPRAKLTSLGFLIVATVSVSRLWSLSALFCIAVVLALFSRISPLTLAKRLWAPMLLFTGVIGVPALFLTPGEEIGRLPLLDWTITAQGARSAALLLLRTETASTFSLLLVLSSRWNELLRALRFFRVPTTLIVIAQMTQRYIFLLLETARNMFESRQTRLVGHLKGPDQRRVAVATAGVLLDRSLQLTGEVHMAMRARGFRGEIHLLEDLEMKRSDWAGLALFFFTAIVFVWLGR